MHFDSVLPALSRLPVVHLVFVVAGVEDLVVVASDVAFDGTGKKGHLGFVYFFSHRDDIHSKEKKNLHSHSLKDT